MMILAVETATAHQSVAIVEDGRVRACVEQQVGSHGERLIPALRQVVEMVGGALGGLDGLAVSAGPGSFTGLRVGLATVSAFRLVTGKPLVMVPTLEGLAWNLAGVDGRICAILKARAGEVY
ncbi:MAG: tRNA (adenosine(37)-N6)-threonylcarbamoyltransferase complex dimerization subunit type 1 TsaB, partial [Nitrospirae bacterium]